MKTRRPKLTGQCFARILDTNGVLTEIRCNRGARYDGFCYQHYQTLITNFECEALKENSK